MVVGAVQTRVREPLHQPAEQRLVADVHPHRDLWLLTVTAERGLADHQPDEQASVELDELRHVTSSTRNCFTA